MRQKRFWIMALVLAITLNVTPAPVAQGATITVDTTFDGLNDSDGHCSLREAIQAANTDSAVDACPAGSGDDTITLPAGTYTLTLAGPDEDNNTTGDLDITDDLTINGAGADSATIDGNQLDRVLHVHGGVAVEINGVEITNGKTPDGVSGGDGDPGGGIYNSGTLTVTNSTISNNTTGRGDSVGGVATGGKGGDGGGIYNDGTLTVTNSTVSSNTTGSGGDGLGLGYSYSGDGGDGGGIYNSGTLTVTNSTISDNATGNGGYATYPHRSWGGGRGGDGGGIYNSGTLTVTNSTVSSNTTGSGGVGDYEGGDGGDGGGIYNSGPLMVANSTISDNTTGNGGGCAAWFGSGGDGGDGGGIYNSGTLMVANSTVSGNTTGDGASNLWNTHNRTGIGGGISAGGTVNVENTIIAGNTDPGGDPDDCSGTLTSQGYNLVEDLTDCTIGGDTTGNVTGQDPRLSPLADNGGSTQTHALHPISPAIDAGSCSTVTADQRGLPRPVDIPDIANADDGCDIGAYEAQEVVLYRLYLPLISKN
jgi:CSLREA domain-containing protein